MSERAWTPIVIGGVSEYCSENPRRGFSRSEKECPEGMTIVIQYSPLPWIKKLVHAKAKERKRKEDEEDHYGGHRGCHDPPVHADRFGG